MQDSRVSIGLPTYNRPAGLQQTIECLRAQTFRDFDVMISDNASTDPEVGRVAAAAVRQDARFRYVRQSENRGAFANFMSTLAAAGAPYFMWSADDDLLDPRFIETGLAALERTPSARAWMCTVAHINIDGEVVRRLDGFSRFTSSKSKLRDLLAFLNEPEILGKANLICGLFERTALQRCTAHMGIASTWGFDMAIVYAFLARYDVVGTDEVLLLKRHWTHLKDTPVGDPRRGVFPRANAPEYIGALVHAAAQTPYVLPTWLAMHWRWLRAPRAP